VDRLIASRKVSSSNMSREALRIAAAFAIVFSSGQAANSVEKISNKATLMTLL
jgi:hypothetical protein